MDEYQRPPGNSLFSLNIDANNGRTLHSAVVWAKVLAICGLVMGVLSVIGGFFVRNVMKNSPQFNDMGYSEEITEASRQYASVMGLLIYLAIGAVFVVSSIFALNFSSRVRRALQSNDSQALASGFAGLRNYFAIWSIIMIISILFTFLGMAGLAIGSMVKSP